MCLMQSVSAHLFHYLLSSKSRRRNTLYDYTVISSQDRKGVNSQICRHRHLCSCLVSHPPCLFSKSTPAASELMAGSAALTSGRKWACDELSWPVTKTVTHGSQLTPKRTISISPVAVRVCFLTLEERKLLDLKYSFIIFNDCLNPFEKNKLSL